MKKIPGDAHLLALIEGDPYIASVGFELLEKNYEEVSKRFHEKFSANVEDQHKNAIFHRIRYLNLLSRTWSGNVLDVGNDKPFLTFFLRKFNPNSYFCTISNEIPQTPFDLWEVDIEQEELPFNAEFFDSIIFTEVIEHLWRDPSYAIAQMNAVLKIGGALFVTTPNPCDRHSLVCILWQANPNQRSGYYATLESGHLHLWTVQDLKLILEANGFEVPSISTLDLYGHTREDANIEEIIARISPHRSLMNETVVAEAIKKIPVSSPSYPMEIFPDGCPVQFSGAIEGFVQKNLSKSRG